MDSIWSTQNGSGYGRSADKSEAKGFTLIELLVVIAVLSLLLSVILPALNNPKLATKQVACAAQMRQWTLATIAYTEEHDYVLTPFAGISDATKGGNALNSETYYYNRLSPYLTGEDHGQWGMEYGNRRCPMGKTGWGEKAVLIGVFYSNSQPEL